MEDEKTTVTCVINGPARIKGNFTITLPSGEVKEMEQVALCRCGQSDLMPFCNGSHKNAIPGHDET